MARLENDIAINYLTRLINIVGVEQNGTSDKLTQVNLIIALLQLERARLQSQKAAGEKAELLVTATGFPHTSTLVSNFRQTFSESQQAKTHKKRLAVTWLKAIADHSPKTVAGVGQTLDRQNRYAAVNQTLFDFSSQTKKDVESICQNPTNKVPLYEHPQCPGLLVAIPGEGLSGLKLRDDHYARKYIDSSAFSKKDQTFGSLKKTVDLENLPTHNRFPLLISGHLPRNTNLFRIDNLVTPIATAFARYKGGEAIRDKDGEKIATARPRQVYSCTINAPVANQISTIGHKSALHSSYELDDHILDNSWLNIDFASLSSKSVDLILSNFNRLVDLTRQTIKVAENIAKNLPISPAEVATAQELLNLINSLEESSAKTEIQDTIRKAFNKACDQIKSPL